MVTQTTTTFPVLPEFARQPVADIAATVAEQLKTPLKVPLQQVAGLSPTQVSAMNLAQQVLVHRPWLVPSLNQHNSVFNNSWIRINRV